MVFLVFQFVPVALGEAEAALGVFQQSWEEGNKVQACNKAGNSGTKMLNFHGTVQISRFYRLEQGNPSSPNWDKWGSSHLSELQFKAAWKAMERALCQHMLGACSQFYLYVWEQDNCFVFFRGMLGFSSTILWQWVNSTGKLYSHRTYRVWNMDKLVGIK